MAKKFFFCGALRPLVSVNNDFLKRIPWKANGGYESVVEAVRILKEAMRLPQEAVNVPIDAVIKL